MYKGILDFKQMITKVHLVDAERPNKEGESHRDAGILLGFGNTIDFTDRLGSG